ncbi:MAG TPA: serine/threonine-protein kinase [Thermoanaerobaculia bacterium]|nr:serine/threonine-protein kinase [Thermoanaerobaculia bacterium]
MKSDLWERLLLALVGAKLLAALIGVAVGVPSPADRAEGTILSPLLLLLPLCVYGLGGAILVLGGSGDRRAALLGTFFLLLATPFSNRPLLRLVEAGTPGLDYPALVLSSLHFDAFLPFFFWKFVGEFPTTVLSFRTRRVLAAGTLVSLISGFILFGAEVALLLAKWARSWSRPVASLSEIAPEKPSYGFYSIVLGLSVLALVFLLTRMGKTTEPERLRARIFVAGLAAMAPFLIFILIDAAADWFLGRSLDVPFPVYVLMFLLFCSVPFTTSYAVAVDHVLNVRLIARKALQYALARYSALALALVPLVALVAYVFEHRDQRIREIFSGPRLPLLASAVIVGGAALRYRRTLLDSIDRHFFREQYDARQTLTLLVERVRATHGVAELGTLLCREVDLALHPESVALLSFEPRSGMLTDPKVRGRRLDASSPLAALIGSASDPLVVDLEDSRSPLAKLPEVDRYWLVDNGFRLIVPILARDGSLLGLIGLGEKKSELPFLKEDRMLLRAIANSIVWVLEVELSRSLGSSRSWQEPVEGPASLPPTDQGAGAELAKECLNCGRLYASYTVFCTSCSRRLEPSHVPYLLPGKFRFERRLGTGGMGVVYRGTDLSLGRPVAVKTLRRVSPEDAMRLRREARTAAAVSHPHLAPVYGMETWQGTPMLVMELLEGGTLSQRIEKGRLDAAETVELGIAMAEALEHLHASDILHRDIKPSNIGYTRDGTPKLMDFGIARVMFDLRRDVDVPPAANLDDDPAGLPPTSVWNRLPTTETMSKQLVGTLAYLSPEALNGQPADTSFDLWSLAIVLYECLLGRKIFAGGDMQQLMSRIRNGRVPDFSQACPGQDELLGDFFRSALHKTVTRRPATASELKRRLIALRPRLAA